MGVPDVPQMFRACAAPDEHQTLSLMSSETRQLRLGAFMRPAIIHSAGWRYPGGFPDANFNFAHLQRFAQTLERGCFDAFFMADHLALMNMPIDALKRSATVTSFDPLTLLPALAVVTAHIGLIATASTSYNDPYHIARKFASLDHLSNGRAGWNVVTSQNPLEALNFGRDEHLEHAARYRQAREFYDVVTGLWDSWADDAFLRDMDNGIYFDPEKLHVLNHAGPAFKVRGPLNVARPVQGWPVIVQAGASDAGRQLAAETAEAIFGAASSLAAAQAFYTDVKARTRAAGRNPEHLKILPGVFVVIGDTVAEARATKRRLDSLVYHDSAIASLNVLLGYDVSSFPLDGPLPEIPETNASKSSREKLVALARDDGMSIRELAQLVGGSFGLMEMVGTPATIAEEMETWLLSGACDGFNIMFPFLPQGLDDFVNPHAAREPGPAVHPEPVFRLRDPLRPNVVRNEAREPCPPPRPLGNRLGSKSGPRGSPRVPEQPAQPTAHRAGHRRLVNLSRQHLEQHLQRRVPVAQRTCDLARGVDKRAAGDRQFAFAHRHVQTALQGARLRQQRPDVAVVPPHGRACQQAAIEQRRSPRGDEKAEKP